ncbi:MAG: hypothetical protein FWD31_01500 [Planctomycetaceae bacterium]|nr:hypothetical protein [Planctomycetaceae bacterium]
MSRLFFLAVALICCYGLSGCDFPEIKRPVRGVAGVDIDPDTTMSGGSSTTESNPVPTQQVVEQPAPQPPENRRAAQVGDGRQGHYEQFGRMSIFSHNIGTMYRTRENLTYNVQIPHAMNFYKATHGRAPQTHEEFWREIIQANNLRMPELKEGCHYDYNPQTEELEVVFPRSISP